MCDKRASRSSPARNRTASVGYAWLGLGGGQTCTEGAETAAAGAAA